MDLTLVIAIINLVAVLIVATITVISQRRLSRLEANLNREKTVSDAQYQLRYQACLDALEFVDQSLLISTKPLIDAKYSEHGEKPLKVHGFAHYSQCARENFNQLVLACEDPEVIELFRKIIFPEKGEWVTADLKIDFQRAIRRELGFSGDILYEDRERAFLATTYPEVFSISSG